MRRFLFVLSFVCASLMAARADNVGILAFSNVDIGVNALSINNLTGISALPPDFPHTTLLFSNGTLDLSFLSPLLSDITVTLPSGPIAINSGSSSASLMLGSISEGDTVQILFSSDIFLSEASFSADTSDGKALGSLSDGGGLQDGALALLQLPAQPVPEPATLVLLASGIGLFRLKRSNRKKD